MSKIAFGVPNKHIQASHGGDNDLMKFYSTQYGTTYGRNYADFQPRNGKHTGTGYLSNFRPGVYYAKRLDDMENPEMGRLISGNYSSITQRSYGSYRGPSGKEPLPNGTVQVGSGFVRQRPITTPCVKDVNNVCIDTRVASCPADIRPFQQPYLHKIRPKDPVERENEGYGPGFMTTESSAKFKTPPRDKSTNGSLLKQESGFTHAYNVEPVTFVPNQAYKTKFPGCYNNRPIGTSIMKRDFQLSEFSNGKEPLPSLPQRADRDTGFTSGTKSKPVFLNRVMGDAYDKACDIPAGRLAQIKKQDPAEYINTNNPNNHSSIAAGVFKGEQIPSVSESDRLGKTDVGPKDCSTGYTVNNDRYIAGALDPRQFTTHYNSRFLDYTPVGDDRKGHTWGGVQKQRDDGFTKSTQVHTYRLGDPNVDSTAVLRSLDPYVGRSVMKRDKFFDDHTYDAKLHGKFTRSVTFAL